MTLKESIQDIIRLHCTSQIYLVHDVNRALKDIDELATLIANDPEIAKKFIEERVEIKEETVAKCLYEACLQELNRRTGFQLTQGECRIFAKALSTSLKEWLRVKGENHEKVIKE
jgi:hypothetical protein